MKKYSAAKSSIEKSTNVLKDVQIDSRHPWMAQLSRTQKFINERVEAAVFDRCKIKQDEIRNKKMLESSKKLEQLLQKARHLDFSKVRNINPIIYPYRHIRLALQHHLN